MNLDYNKIGLKVGLEIHQQLSTGKKLFCNCRQEESELFTKKFSRRLRASKSEMGKYDPAAVFEKTKSKVVTYHGSPESSCLVEEDEEPPHDVDSKAKSIALLVASALDSNIFREIFPMRKIVIDGSNTSGFQRTMLISQGGKLTVNNTEIGVQSICLEEDAARLLKDSEYSREYGLDRLGIPLVEIALDPVEADPDTMRNIALALGRLLRTTRSVARGLGSIRQDVNVSVSGGGVVEVKGVQQLDQLKKVVEFEARRQSGLVEIAKRLKTNVETGCKVTDITAHMVGCKSKIIQESLAKDYKICGMRLAGLAGLLGFSPYDGVRLGKEIAQLVRSYGIGGVFHSDELPGYGITKSDVIMIKDRLAIKENDGFLIMALPQAKYEIISEQVINRIEQAALGVPAETRMATQTGETVFLRPRPGPSRMYPETDVPPVRVSDEELKIAKASVPKQWDEIISDLKNRYNLNAQLAEQILDSEYLELFERISNNVSSSFVASALCSTITSLRRKGLDASLLSHEDIERVFALLAEQKIAKESVEIIFESIMSGSHKSVNEAAMSVAGMNDDELDVLLEKVVKENQDLIAKQGSRAIGPLMGVVMKKVRGRVSGEKISKLLGAKIDKVLKN